LTLKDQILYRAKAIIAALGLSLVGFLGWLVENPQTATAIQQVIPAPYAQFVPLILAGIAATWLVHRVPNAAPIPSGADNDDELTSDTTAITLPTTEDGVEAGAGR
jgi:hypothetical protein